MDDIRMPRAEFEELLELVAERAAEKGATRALARVGLHDDEAPQDVRDLRALLDAWRAVRKTARATLVKWFTVAFLTFAAGLAALKLKIGQ